jgi:hypothetical protein
MLAQQLVHFSLKRLVAGARLCHPCCPIRLGLIHGRIENVANLPKLLRRHNFSSAMYSGIATKNSPLQ